MKAKKILFTLVLLLAALVTFSQGQEDSVNVRSRFKYKKEEKQQLDRAEFLFEEKNYLKALELFLDLQKKHPEDYYLNYRIGICYIHKPDEKEKSIQHLELAYQADPLLDDIQLYLGRAYLVNYKFDEATDFLTRYLQGKPDQAGVKEANKMLTWAENGRSVMQKNNDARVENIGDPINTSASEYVPLISTDEAVLIFTYRGERSKGGLMDKTLKPDPDGEYYEDIFISYRIGDEWLTPEPIGENLNTLGHDAAIALSPSGQKLFMFKSTPKDKGDIYISELKGEEWQPPVRLNNNINTNFWEGSCSISSDEKTLYFSSERPGGLGGRDIYRSVRKPNGDWGPAENLGASINTPYNDDAPFIHPDGVSLFFSSEGHNSMGGYDVFVARQGGMKMFSKPENLGYPINTTGDDIYYVLAANGEKGYYSSSRGKGQGGHDIYEVTPSISTTKPVLALVIGNVMADRKPVAANITVTNESTQEEVGTFQSNAATGKFLLTLTPGNKYKIALEVEGYDRQVEYVNVESLDAYVQVAKDFQMTKKDTSMTAGSQLAIADSSNTLQTQINSELEKYKRESTREHYEAMVYNQLLKEKGEEQVEGREFFVDLGKFDETEKKRIESLNAVSPVKRQLSFEGKTRVTAGPFKTLLEAEIYRQKFIQADTSLRATSQVKAEENGQVKTIKQIYPEAYKKQFADEDQAVVQARVSEVTDTTSAPVATIVEEKPKEQKNIISREKLVDFEQKEIEGLSFKVEIGQTKDGEAFNLTQLQKYGPIQAKKYPDGVTRYTMGPFKTLAEAEEFKRMIAEKEPEAAGSLVTVFFFGQRKTVEEFYGDACNTEPVFSHAPRFAGKDLNDKQTYQDMLKSLGSFNCGDYIFKVQIGAYRKPENFKYPQLEKFGPADVRSYPDGVTRFTMKEFRTIAEAENFRQEVIKLKIKDAWITAVYKGERKTLDELMRNNFYYDRGTE